MQIINCNAAGSDLVCSAAQSFCNGQILSPLSGTWDPEYVPVPFPDPFPPALGKYLNNPAVTSKIGPAPLPVWSDINWGVYGQFANTGDWMRSARPALEAVIDAGVRTVIYAGDEDYIVNYMGVEAMVRPRVLSFSPTHFRVIRPLH